MRDVILNLRDRILLGAIEDNPVPHRIYADDRVAVGLYANDSPETVAADLRFAAELAIRSVAALHSDQLARPIFSATPGPRRVPCCGSRRNSSTNRAPPRRRH